MDGGEERREERARVQWGRSVEGAPPPLSRFPGAALGIGALPEDLDGALPCGPRASGRACVRLNARRKRQRGHRAALSKKKKKKTERALCCLRARVLPPCAIPHTRRSTSRPLTRTHTHIHTHTHSPKIVPLPPPQEKKKKWEPPAPPPRVGRKQRRRDAAAGAGGRLPPITPAARCRLRKLKLERVKVRGAEEARRRDGG